MRILIVGAGGVGAAAAAIARRRDFFEYLLITDLDADLEPIGSAQKASPL